MAGDRPAREGQVAVYETTLRPPGSSYEAGIAWMVPAAVAGAAVLRQPEPRSGPVEAHGSDLRYGCSDRRRSLQRGLQVSLSEGGYYAEGRLVYPLRTGGASLVIYRGRNATVGSWGQGLRMTPNVIAVRQNLTLLVNRGRPVAGLNPGDNYLWGATLGGVPAVWRSGLGVTRKGRSFTSPVLSLR